MFDRTTGIVIIPYNINNNHWCLVIVNWDTRSIIQFDPLQKRSVYGDLSKLSRAFVAPLMHGEYAKFTQFTQEQETNLKQSTVV